MPRKTFYCFNEIEQSRKALLHTTTEIYLEPLGTGENKRMVQIRNLAATSISDRFTSVTLFKLIDYLKPGNMIELGTSLGINSLYMAYANNAGTLYTLEGRKEVADQALKLFKEHKKENIVLETGAFDDTLPSLLHKLSSIDLVFIDGNHTFEATSRYFDWLSAKAGNHTVLVFHDIYWSDDMTRAWEGIKSSSNVTLTIDLYYIGVVFFDNHLSKQDFVLRFTSP